MRVKYLRSANLFCCTRKNTDSSIWKAILKCRALLQKGVIWKIGKGDEISFWFDNWIDNRNLVEILGVSEDSDAHPEVKVCEFIRDNLEWDVPKPY